MKYRNLGTTNEKLSAIGLGCMAMTNVYGTHDEATSIAVLNKAIELGINFWDTADIYANGENEKLISKVLKPNRDKIFIATKFGFKPSDAGHFSSGFDGSPQWMRQAVEQSLKRLGVDHIDLYYAHRVDKNIPIEETVGAMADLVKEGKVRYLSLSEASVTSLKKAHSVHPISALQSEYSLLTRDVEAKILPATKEMGISFIPFSPLGRGMFTDNFDTTQFAENDTRWALPRFQGEHLINNQKLMAELNDFAHSKNVNTAQLALAWILSKSDHILPIPGTKRIKYLELNAKAVDVNLSAADIADIEGIITKYPNTGERYAEANLALIDKD